MTEDLVWDGEERTFDADDFIVSKTDLKGRITYANKTFVDVSGFEEEELLGKPHSVIRHQQMPGCIYKLLWGHITDNREIFAYVVNRCKGSGYYWVFAQVTPTFSPEGEKIGYHSNRRLPKVDTIQNIIVPLYHKLRTVELTEKTKKLGIEKSYQMLMDQLKEQEVTYDEWILQI